MDANGKIFRVSDEKQLSESLRKDSTEDLIFEFLKSFSPKTEAAYRKDLKAFFKFTREKFNLPELKDGDLEFSSIRRVHITKYKCYLDAQISKRNKPYAPNTISKKISTVASFFRFLHQREVIEKSPTENFVRPPQLVIYETQVFSDIEMRCFFDLVIRDATPLHKAIILLLFTTGMRQAELRSLKLTSFHYREGILFIRYIAKGQKINLLPVHPTTAFYIDEYKNWMRAIGREITEEDFLFQPTKNTYDGMKKKKLSHTAVGYIVKKWARRINNEKRITPHSARATFISSLIEAGVDIYYISQLVNHGDVRVTQKYNKRIRNHRNNPIFNLNFF